MFILITSTTTSSTTSTSISTLAASFSPVETMNNHNPDPSANNGVDPEMEGYKWSLAAFRRWLARKEGDNDYDYDHYYHRNHHYH